jgi:helicase
VLDRGLLSTGFNCVLQMPTGAGKTWLAECAIADTLGRGRRAIYLAPLRALASELLERWRCEFSPHEVGIFTGEYGGRRPYPVAFDRARLLIMTPERLDQVTRTFRRHWGWLPEVDLIVADELHMLGDAGRGPRLEGALLRAMRLNPFLRIVGLTATLGNRRELARWLDGVDYETRSRPVPLAWRVARFRKPDERAPLVVAEVSRAVSAGGQSIVFVESRRRAETYALALSESGIATSHHHAGLDTDERRRVETAFRSGELRALVSTGTIEMGLNFPARLVVIADLQRFDGSSFVPLSVNSVWQRAGRAGRPGLDTEGEVVLVAPAWDRDAGRYSEGRFEPIRSGLAHPRALAEQIVVEVASGLARTRDELRRSLDLSLAAFERRLPDVSAFVDDMVACGMLEEVERDRGRSPKLAATALGHIASRQMLEPETVLALARALRAPDSSGLSFLDILLVCASTADCSPVIAMDFEEIDALGARLASEPSMLLAGNHADVLGRLEARGRRLAAIIKTATLARAWTLSGDAGEVAREFGCYAFEVRRLTESLGRILVAALAVARSARPSRDDDRAPGGLEPGTVERLAALGAMVASGVDEQAVTLTCVAGIGPTMARRLGDHRISDIEDLAAADLEELTCISGIGEARARRWIADARTQIGTRTAYAFRQSGGAARVAGCDFPEGVDPYRLGRATALDVGRDGNAFLVSGGLEPHRVRADACPLLCDCGDFASGHVCKHVLAVRLASGDATLRALAARLAETSREGLDLFQLWFEGGRR